MENLTGNDMIVNLMTLPKEPAPFGDVKIKRAFIGDKQEILEFVRDNFGSHWLGETETALLQNPAQCFIATEHGRLLGFACYDATAKGFFGPTGVLLSERGKHIGASLLLRTLHAMKEAGYGYAAIGWVGDAELFYRKTVSAEMIPGGTPEHSVYSNMIKM